MRFKPLALAALTALTLAACAPQARVSSAASAALPAPPEWAFARSDVPLDPEWKTGTLDNGMRFILRRNSAPKGTALVRMQVDVGSLDEGEDERGFAHYVEHMAFNGSTNVPEGEMVRLLERKGLAFGADTNAQTSFEHTTYLLDLPEANDELLGTALMLMRETASELKFDPEAVNRERGVILSERRDRNTWQFRALEDQLAFTAPGSRYASRLPIGTAEALNGASAEALKAFWARHYVPAKTTLIVVGDFPVEAMEAAVRARFADWKAAPRLPQPPAGPIRPSDKGRTSIYIDPAMPERVAAMRHGQWLDEDDTLANRRENLLRQVGYGIINRRLQRAARVTEPPFRAAGFGTGDAFEEARTTNLIADTVDRKWQRGLTTLALEYRRAMAFGFTEAEVAEQVANLRNAARNEAEQAATRSHSALVQAAFALVRDDRVPSTPQGSLERLEEFAPQITPASVLAALKREAVPLKDPLLRFQGRYAPEGGEKAIRAAWNAAMRTKLARDTSAATTTFAYTDFGAPGQIVADEREGQLGIRRLRFANGVRLNLKRTELEKDRVHVQLSLDGGERLATKANPLAVEMLPFLPAGGLGKHSQDELQSLLAGRSVGLALAATPETFTAAAQTTPRDLELQLQLYTAALTDPGFRPEGEVQFRLNINNFFAQLRATPGSALGNLSPGILSDDDPRFTLQKVDDYRKLTFPQLKEAVADRFAKGAIEIGLVGDIDEEAAIALVAKTFGALPAREAEFGRYAEQRARSFTADRSPRVLRHTGAKDQAVLRLIWPTRDDADPIDNRRFAMLERVVQLVMTDTLREKLGKAYSPGVQSMLTYSWDGYGTFAVTASVDVADLAATRAAIAEALAALRDAPVSEDIIQRARQPQLEAWENALKTNRGWLSLVDRAQSEADRIDRHLRAKERLLGVTSADVQALARRYLAKDSAVEITVLPEGVDP